MEIASQSFQSSSACIACDSNSLELEKIQMVCRHWRSKGWCRYESQCKFSHPENKRGVNAKCTEVADVPGLSQSRRKRGAQNNKLVVALDSRLNAGDSCNLAF